MTEAPPRVPYWGPRHYLPPVVRGALGIVAFVMLYRLQHYDLLLAGAILVAASEAASAILQERKLWIAEITVESALTALKKWKAR